MRLVRPDFLSPQFPPRPVWRQGEQPQSRLEPLRNAAVQLDSDFATPSLRFHHAGQGNELTADFQRPSFQNLQRETLMLADSRRTQQSPQSPRHPALRADHLAYIVRSDSQFENVAVQLSHRNLLRFVNQRLRHLLDQGAYVPGLLTHDRSN